MKNIHGRVSIASTCFTCPTVKVIFCYSVGKVFQNIYKTRKYFVVMDDLIVCKTQTEAVRNIDSQNEWHTKSGSNYILIVLLSISVMDLTKYGFSVSKCKDDAKRKADERDSKEKNKNRRGKKIQRS